MGSNKKSKNNSHCHTEDLTTAGNVKRGTSQQQHNKSEILTNALSSLKALEEENFKLNNEILTLKKNLLARNNATRRLQPCLWTDHSSTAEIINLLCYGKSLTTSSCLTLSSWGLIVFTDTEFSDYDLKDPKFIGGTMIHTTIKSFAPTSQEKLFHWLIALL